MKALLVAVVMALPVAASDDIPGQPPGIAVPIQGEAYCYPKDGYCVVRFEDLLKNERTLHLAAKLLKSCGPVRSM